MARKIEIPCCTAWEQAQQSGTDNEGYGALLYFVADDEPRFGCNLPTVENCPWCGKSKSAAYEHPKNTPTEFAWLIERVDSEPCAPLYFSAMGGCLVPYWSPDSLQAMRFARKEDAAKMGQHLGEIETNCEVRICEHGWGLTPRNLGTTLLKA